MRLYVNLMWAGTLAVAALVPDLAAAQSQDQLPVVRVPISDLDLAVPRDRKVLDRRIWSATLKVCQSSIDLPPYVPDRCSSEASRSARRQRDALVAQQSASRTGRYARTVQPQLIRKVAEYRCGDQSDGPACHDDQARQVDPHAASELGAKGTE